MQESPTVLKYTDITLSNVNIESTARCGNSDLQRLESILSIFPKWIRYGANGCHHHDTDKKRHRPRGFRHPTISTEPVT